MNNIYQSVNDIQKDEKIQEKKTVLRKKIVIIQETPRYLSKANILPAPALSAKPVSLVLVPTLPRGNAYFDPKTGLKVYVYVVLENHCHFIVQSSALDHDIARYKPYTAKQIIQYLSEDKVRQILEQLVF